MSKTMILAAIAFVTVALTGAVCALSFASKCEQREGVARLRVVPAVLPKCG